MPIYRYHCQKCNTDSEVLLPRFDAQALCPACGSDDLKKLPSHFAAVTRSASGCAMQDSCPAAGGHCCGGNCGCHGH